MIASLNIVVIILWLALQAANATTQTNTMEYTNLRFIRELHFKYGNRIMMYDRNITPPYNNYYRYQMECKGLLCNDFPIQEITCENMGIYPKEPFTLEIESILWKCTPRDRIGIKLANITIDCNSFIHTRSTDCAIDYTIMSLYNPSYNTEYAYTKLCSPYEAEILCTGFGRALVTILVFSMVLFLMLGCCSCVGIGL